MINMFQYGVVVDMIKNTFLRKTRNTDVEMVSTVQSMAKTAAVTHMMYLPLLILTCRNGG